MRRPYGTPRLKLYGSVRALTASGTGSMVENVRINGMGTMTFTTCSPVTNRRPCQ